MTIAEHLRQQVRTSNRIKWAGILAVVVVAFVQVHLKHSNTEMYAWMAAVAAPWFVAITALAKRMKCPRCQKALAGELSTNRATPWNVLGVAKREWIGKDSLPIEECPNCGCKFSEPYIGG